MTRAEDPPPTSLRVRPSPGRAPWRMAVWDTLGGDTVADRAPWRMAVRDTLGGDTVAETRRLRGSVSSAVPSRPEGRGHHQYRLLTRAGAAPHPLHVLAFGGGRPFRDRSTPLP